MVKEIKKIISKACVYFTLVEFLLLIIAPYIMKTVVKSVGEANFLTLRSAAFIFLALLLLSALDLVFKIPRVPSAILRVIHYFLCLTSALIPIICVPKKTPPEIILISIIFISVLYIVLSLVTYFIKTFFGKKENDGEYNAVIDGEVK